MTTSTSPELLVDPNVSASRSSIDNETPIHVDLSRSRSLSSPKALLRPRIPNLSPPTSAVTFIPLPLKNSMFVLVEVEKSVLLEICGTVAHDMTKDNFTVADDKSFVETSAAPVALGLKKLYDQIFGAGKEGVISPYTITSLTREGEPSPVLRIGHRDEHSVQEGAPPAQSRSLSKSSGRLSVHHFLPPLFKSSQSSSNGNFHTSNSFKWSASAGSIRSKNKLHKKRSLTNVPSSSNTRSRSGTADSHKSSLVSETSGSRSRDPLSPRIYGAMDSNVDLMAELLGWDLSNPSGAPSTSQPSPVTPSREEGLTLDLRGLVDPLIMGRMNSAPFGEDIQFSAPTSSVGGESPLKFTRFSSEHMLRHMQSFDSNLTARALSIESEEPNVVFNESASPSTPTSARFRPEIFDVLQSYTGIRGREALSGPNDPTAGPSPTPEDDPRFVIWGTRMATQGRNRSFSSIADDNVRIVNQQRMIIAASIERWVAQLTSALDYDELLDFYLTYRSYLSPVDLCQLLISRYQWSLQSSNSSIDAPIKQIVRIRTFLAIRYWLSTFFAVDFLPNRDLRLLFAGWINTMSHDPEVAKNASALRTIQDLRKLAKESRDRHFRPSVYLKLARPASRSQPHVPMSEAKTTSSGESNSDPSAGEYNPADYLDLDFEANRSAPRSSVHQRLDLANTFTPMSLQGNSGSTSYGAGNTSVLRSTSGLMMKQPLHMKILQSAQNPASAIAPTKNSSSSLPHHSTISRAFANTIGRFGRWKRDLHSRSRRPTTLSCVSGFGPESDNSGTNDLLVSKQGLEEYLKTLNIPQKVGGTVNGPQPSSETSSTPIDEPKVDILAPGLHLGVEKSSVQEDSAAHTSIQLLDITPNNDSSIPSGSTAIPVGSVARASSQYNGSGSDRSQTWYPENPDYDSDYESSGMGVPLNHQRTHSPSRRRLPKRTDFELVPRGSVSSLGTPSVDSETFAESVASRESIESEVGPSSIKMWQLNVMLDSKIDEEEPGDAAAALRRLEGQIDSSQQHLKERRVSGWLRTVQERMQGGVDDDMLSDITTDEDPTTPPDEPNGVEETPAVEEPPVLSDSNSISTASQIEAPTSSAHSTRADPPAEVLLSTKPSPKILVPESTPGHGANGGLVTPQSRFIPNLVVAPTAHRSFVMTYSSEQVAKHWCLVDRDFFLAVKFEELTIDDYDWMQPRQCDDVLDWSAYMKERMKLKAESRVNPQVKAPTSIMTSRLRFTLMVKFVASEIVLSPPSERLAVASKFIRIAWKSYMINSFHTVVAIMTGLQTRWVVRCLGRSWSKVGFWESRLFSDLQVFTSRIDAFLHLRQAVTSLSATGKRNDNSKPSGLADSGKSCVPFFGVYLAQLAKHNQLPDYIDPSSPSRVLRGESSRRTSGIFNLEVFDDLKPLPSFVELTPLLNVHKQRLIASVIKSLVSGQHLASGVDFQVDPKLYWKCVRIKCLDEHTLEQLSFHSV